MTTTNLIPAPPKPRKLAKSTSLLTKPKKSEFAKSVSKIEYLTEDEYIRLQSVCDKPEHKLLMRLLWETGLRISEALGLKYGSLYPDGVLYYW